MDKLLACNCLNVIIETNSDEFVDITQDLLGDLREDEANDPFFKQGLKLIGKLININKSHSGLIQTRNVGCWIVHYCINCDVHSHAVHREKGAACVIVNSNLLDSEKIEKVRNSEEFSKLFKIVVATDSFDSSFVANPYLPDEVQSVIKSIKDLASDILKRESLATDIRVKEYSDKQYNMLDELKERTFREQQAIIRTIIEGTLGTTANLKSTQLIHNTPKGVPSRLNEPLAAGSVKTSAKQKPQVMRHTPKRQKSCPASGHLLNTSFDAEGLFQFDGMDQAPSASESEVEESDVDDNRDDGQKIIGGSNEKGINMIAKSLPMSIPAFMSQARMRDNEDIDEIIPFEDSVDIAASMKALAKSVHGDPVFGDLPKPRYSTYI